MTRSRIAASPDTFGRYTRPFAPVPMTRASILLLAGLAACAHSSQAARPASGSGSSSRSVAATTVLDPVGSYSFNTEINGQPVTGTFVIRAASGGYAGSITAHGQGEFPVTSVKVEGMSLTMLFDTPNGTGTAKLQFSGAEFVGGWELGGTTGPMNGKRTP